MKNPFFSIIIPTLNEELLLPALLESLSKQSFVDLEVIVADNASSDRTPQIIEKYNARTALGDNRPGVGRNNGASIAQGKYLVFLDADTHISHDFLNLLHREIHKRKFGAASGFFIGDSGSAFDRLTHAILNYYFWALQKIDPHACGFYFVIRRSLFMRLEGFDETLFIAEDHDLAWRANKTDKFVFLRNPRVVVSVRRVEREGLLKTIGKGLYVEVYRVFRKKIHKKLFNYDMGGDK